MRKRKDVIEALATSMDREMVPRLIEWIRDPNRKEAIHAFTEGPIRQVAYAVEYALKLDRETTPVLPPLTLRPTEQCQRCGFVQYVIEGPNVAIQAARRRFMAASPLESRVRGGYATI